jgi:DNA repair exonuclease SbcCD ATPase subunit
VVNLLHWGCSLSTDAIISLVSGVSGFLGSAAAAGVFLVVIRSTVKSVETAIRANDSAIKALNEIPKAVKAQKDVVEERLTSLEKNFKAQVELLEAARAFETEQLQAELERRKEQSPQNFLKLAENFSEETTQLAEVTTAHAELKEELAREKEVTKEQRKKLEALEKRVDEAVDGYNTSNAAFEDAAGIARTIAFRRTSNKINLPRMPALEAYLKEPSVLHALIARLLADRQRIDQLADRAKDEKKDEE